MLRGKRLRRINVSEISPPLFFCTILAAVSRAMYQVIYRSNSSIFAKAFRTYVYTRSDSSWYSIPWYTHTYIHTYMHTYRALSWKFSRGSKHKPGTIEAGIPTFVLITSRQDLRENIWGRGKNIRPSRKLRTQSLHDGLPTNRYRKLLPIRMKKNP